MHVPLKGVAALLLLGALGVVGQAATTRYTVQPGDTLSAISRRYGVSVADLVAANHLADPDHIRYGASLAIPTPGTESPPAPPAQVHVVVPGEHLAAIASRYGTTVTALAVTNRIADPNLVIAGARLVVPAAGAPLPEGPPELQRSPRLELAPRFDHWAGVYGVPSDLMKAMAWYESGWQNHVVSTTGARGIGQLMPATAQFINTQLLHARLDPKQPDDNIRMSTRFMRFLLDSTRERADLALSAYYQGLTPTLQGRILDETRRYVAGVLAFRALFRAS